MTCQHSRIGSRKGTPHRSWLSFPRLLHVPHNLSCPPARRATNVLNVKSVRGGQLRQTALGATNYSRHSTQAEPLVQRLSRLSASSPTRPLRHDVSTFNGSDPQPEWGNPSNVSCDWCGPREEQQMNAFHKVSCLQSSGVLTYQPYCTGSDPPTISASEDL